MAKTFRAPVDKLERKARLAGNRNIRDTERREMRNLNRIGWQEDQDDIEDMLTDEDFEQNETFQDEEFRRLV